MAKSQVSFFACEVVILPLTEVNQQLYPNYKFLLIRHKCYFVLVFDSPAKEI